MRETVSDRVRLRLREEMARRNLNQTDIAGMLGWKQSRISKILNGTTGLDVDVLAALCFAVGLSLVEAVRDQGLEFCAEMTPTELRMLERIRQLTPAEVDAFKTLLQVHPNTRMQRRHAAPLKKRFGKPRHAV